VVRTFGYFVVFLAVSACGARSAREGNEPISAGGTGGTSGGGGSVGGTDSPLAGSAGSGTSGGETSGGSAGDTSGSGGSNASGAGDGGGGDSGGMTANGGASGTAATAGTAGAAGAFNPTLEPCNSSDLSCQAGSFCDYGRTSCDPATDATCEGYCVTPLQRGCAGPNATEPCPDGYECLELPRANATDPLRTTCVESPRACTADEECQLGFVCAPQEGTDYCAPERAPCFGGVSCAEVPAPCAPGFVRSTVDGCWGSCVRVEQCLCGNYSDCGAEPATCDRSTGTCAIPRAPAPRCLVPVDLNCGDRQLTFYAFVDGRCQTVTGDRCGMPNEFLNLQECQTFCEGIPLETMPCAEGFRHATVCVSCGPLGGCGWLREMCAKTCTTGDECALGEGCVDGVCDVRGCI
jgi:hypothetical protein